MLNTIFSNYVELLIFIFIVSIVVYRRIQKGVYGGKFKSWRVYFFPILYLLLTISIIYSDWKIYNYYSDFSLIFLIIIGMMIGIRFGQSVHFFYKNNVLFYRRSPYIIAFWTVSFLLRLSFDFFISPNILYSDILDAVLALTSGLLVGEAYHVVRKKNEFTLRNSPKNLTDSSKFKKIKV